MVLETAESVNNGNPSPLEALLAGAEGFPPMLDIPHRPAEESAGSPLQYPPGASGPA